MKKAIAMTVLAPLSTMSLVKKTSLWQKQKKQSPSCYSKMAVHSTGSTAELTAVTTAVSNLMTTIRSTKHPQQFIVPLLQSTKKMIIKKSQKCSDPAKLRTHVRWAAVAFKKTAISSTILWILRGWSRTISTILRWKSQKYSMKSTRKHLRKHTKKA